MPALRSDALAYQLCLKNLTSIYPVLIALNTMANLTIQYCGWLSNAKANGLGKL